MKSKISTFLWGAVTMALALALSLYISTRQKVFLEENQVASPDAPLGWVVLYFFGAVAFWAVLLFVLRLKWLKLLFRGLFALIFAWGIFILAALHLPATAAYALAAATGLAWLFYTRAWLHNILLIITLAAAGSVFGFFVSPWTFMIFMLVIAVYDVVAVRFGFMVWMADKLSESSTLPAFVFPRSARDWKYKITGVRIKELKDQETDKRQYAVLGGGDIGLPLMLAASVYFASGMARAVIVGVFALAGLMCAFWIQMRWLKGKPMPALPPITLLSLIGFLVTKMIY